MILYEDTFAPGPLSHIRIGYVIRESDWGKGIASELVAGLVDWARSDPTIGWIIAGVGSDHGASARVLTKNGFTSTSQEPDENTHTYTLQLMC